MNTSSGSSFTRVLVANRGEIAVRILRACRARGATGLAVYSDADAGAPHVWLADGAARLGPAEPGASYLDAERILDAAGRLGADAIHPGYGFLAENAVFADAVLAAGLVWIGPPPEAIRAMGEKTAARRTMEAGGVPVIPGTVEPVLDAARADRFALEAGYPVLLKATAGGGGKGMRVVDDSSAMESAFVAASREAMTAFGDAALYIEKYLAGARHIEIQIVADTHGNTIHLGERECSLQRRHQKILEEAPAPGLDQAMRDAMSELAVRAAIAIDYVGAGTVEFLLANDGSFYFLEMNTRLQVEHPITERVTGVDLVALQLAIAAGEALPADLGGSGMHGHAIECRITAEDPTRGFVPATGTISRYREPGGPGVRVDSGVAVGFEVTPHYDPLLAKVITWGADRAQAIARMRSALDEMRIVGVVTNLSFQRALLDDPCFVAGTVHTGYLEQAAERIIGAVGTGRDVALAAGLAALAVHERYAGRATKTSAPVRVSGWRSDDLPFVWYGR